MLALRVAPRTPAIPPTSTPITVATAASSRVRRKRSPRSAATGNEVAVERPRSPRRSPEIGHVLDGPGAIELPALAQLAHDLVGREVAGEDARGIAGDEPDDGEDEPGHHEERRHPGDQAGEDAAPGHVVLPRLSLRSRRDAGGGATRVDSSRGP